MPKVGTGKVSEISWEKTESIQICNGLFQCG